MIVNWLITTSIELEGVGTLSSSLKVRPGWVTFVCIGLWVCAVLFIALAVVLLVKPGTGQVEATPVEKALFFITLGSLFVLAGVGLWRMEKWGIIFLALAFGVFKTWDLLSSDNIADMILDIPAAIAIVYLVFRLWEIIDRAVKN